MFAKDNSSLFGTGTKKGKEVALRKSDRRNLRNKMYETLLLPVVPPPPRQDNNDDDNDMENKSMLHRVIDDICLQGGNIVQRQLVYTPEYKKVTIYLKSPTSTCSSNSPTIHADAADANAFIITWPFTLHAQAIWMELDVSAHEKPLQVPTVALLSVLHAAAAAAAAAASQQQPLLLLLPTLAVPSMVSKNLCRGAHLMRAGIFAMPHPPLPQPADSVAATTRLLLQSPPPKKQSRLVALVVMSSAHDDDRSDDDDETNNALLHLHQQQPFAVGLLHPAIQSVEDIGYGTKGVGVEILTCYGDDFWRLQHERATSFSASRSATGSGRGIVSLTGGAPFDAGNYGNVGFVNGEYVVPVVAAVGEKVLEKEEEEESGDTDSNPATVTDVDPKKTTACDDDDDAINASSSVLHEATTNQDGINENDATTTTTTKPQDNDGDDEGATVAALSNDVDETRRAEDATIDSHINMTPDDILHESVCRALVALHPAKRFLPMPMSTFYANHVLKHKPPGVNIELKKTKYKKFGSYVQAQVSRKLVEAGPAPGANSGSGSNIDPLGMLTGYDRRHADLQIFMQQAKESAADQSAAPNGSDETSRRRLVLVDLYRVPSHYVSLLRLDPDAVAAAHATSVDRRNTGYLTAKEVREILEQYIARESLVDATNKGCVHLDGPLTDALFPSSKKQSKDASPAPSPPPPATLSRKDVVTKWQSRMENAYALVQMPGNVILQMHRGPPPMVTITVTKRQNRKFITRVRGVEHYGINALQFKNDISQRLACAGSVEDSPMEKMPHKDHVELVFQGNIHEELQALLLGDSSLSSHGGVSGDSDYCQLPKNCINVILRKGVPGHKK